MLKVQMMKMKVKITKFMEMLCKGVYLNMILCRRICTSHLPFLLSLMFSVYLVQYHQLVHLHAVEV